MERFPHDFLDEAIKVKEVCSIIEFALLHLLEISGRSLIEFWSDLPNCVSMIPEVAQGLFYQRVG